MIRSTRLLLAVVVSVAIAAIVPTAGASTCAGTIAIAQTTHLGAEGPGQVRWARLAIADFNSANSTAFRAEVHRVANTAAGPAAVARAVVAGDAIGMVGFQRSTQVIEGGSVFDRAGLAYVSPSATRTSLTNGAHRAFFRVVPPDSIQAPTIARYAVRTWHARNVVVVNDDDAYSTDLTDATAKALSGYGLTPTRLRVVQGAPSYTDAVAAIGPDVDTVVLGLSTIADVNRFAADLAASGRTPHLIGGDAAFSSSLDAPGMAVTSYLGDVEGNAFGRAASNAYRARYGAFDPTGAAAYTAARSLMTAAMADCEAHGDATRTGVLAELPGIRLSSSIFGHPVSFTASHNPRGATYYVWTQKPDGRFRVTG